MSEKVFSIAIKITSVSPSHIHFRLYSNMILIEYDHQNATRTGLGSEQCLRREEFPHFINRLDPHIIRISAENLKLLSDSNTAYDIRSTSEWIIEESEGEHE